MGVHLLGLQDPAVHLLPFHLLLAASERRLALDHLIEEAAQTPVVGAQAVPLVVQDLRGWGQRRGVRRGERQPVARAVTRAGQALAVLLPGLIMLVEGLELHGRDSFPLLTPTH